MDPAPVLKASLSVGPDGVTQITVQPPQPEQDDIPAAALLLNMIAEHPSPRKNRSKAKGSSDDDDPFDPESEDDYRDDQDSDEPAPKKRKAQVKKSPPPKSQSDTPKKKRNKGKDTPIPKKVQLPVRLHRNEQGHVIAMDVQDNVGTIHENIKTARPGTVVVPDEARTVGTAMYPLAITNPEACNRLTYFNDSNEDGWLHVHLNPDIDLVSKKALLQAVINCYRNCPELGNRISRRLNRLHRQNAAPEPKSPKHKRGSPKPTKRRKRKRPAGPPAEKPVDPGPIPVIEEAPVAQYSVEEFFNAVNQAEGEMKANGSFDGLLQNLTERVFDE